MPSAWRIVDLLLAALLCASTATLARAAADDPAALFLEQRGLGRQGNYWLTLEERTLKTHLDQLRARDRALRQAQQSLSDARAEIEKLRAEYTTSQSDIERLGGLLADRSLNVKQYNEVVRQLNLARESSLRLQPLFAKPENLLDNARLHSALASLVRAQGALAESVLYIRRHAETVDEGYKLLRADSQVEEALAQAKAKARLGPARSYARELKRLERYDSDLFTDWVPFYREERQHWIPIVLNDSHALPIALHTEDEATLIPLEDLEAAGVEFDPTLPSVTVRAGTAPAFETKQVTLARLQLGGQLLRDVTVIALPRDRRELGPRLGRAALKDVPNELVWENLRLKLHTRNDPSFE